jgi:hypothetical protein
LLFNAEWSFPFISNNKPTVSLLFLYLSLLLIALPGLCLDDPITQTLKQLTDKFPITRQKAAISLAAMRNKEGSVRQAAAYALGRQGAAGVAPLLAALEAQEAGVRAAAAGGLSGSHDPRALEPLPTKIADNEVKVRLTVCRALGIYPEAKTVAPLLNCLQYADAGVRAAAAQTIGGYGSAVVVGHVNGGQSPPALCQQPDSKTHHELVTTTGA